MKTTNESLRLSLAWGQATWYNRDTRTALERGGDPLPHAQAPKVAAMPLDVRLLGEFAILSDGAPVTTVKSQRLQCLLAYLLLHRDAPIARQRLAFLFWPDSSEAQARSNLRNLIHALIQALPDGDRFIQTDNQTVQWRADVPCSVDVNLLFNTLENARTEDDLQHALDLYRGPLMPCCYDDWITPERERLEQKLADVLQRFIDEWEKQRNYRSAITYAQKLVRRDPLREDIYRQMMRLYSLSGDRAGVARAYKECQEILARELDVEPSQQTKEVYDKYIRLDPVALPPGGLGPAAPAPIDTPELAPPVPQPNRGPVITPDVPDQPVTEEQIRQAVLSEALQHETVEIPAAIAAMGAIYLVLLHPVLALGDLAFFGVLGTSVIALLAGAVSFTWRSVFHYDEAYEAKSITIRKQHEQVQLEQLHTRLIEGFTETRLAEGHHILRDLDYEFKEMQALIARHKQTDSLTLSYLPSLIGETFHQGLNVLDDVLELARASSSDHDKRLEAENKELESKIQEIQKKGEEGRVKLLQEKIKSNRQRLEMFDRERLRLEGLLQQARKCQTALHDTRIQIAYLNSESGTVKVNAVLETLQRTIDQARAVQDEMRKLGY